MFSPMVFTPIHFCIGLDFTTNIGGSRQFADLDQVTHPASCSISLNIARSCIFSLIYQKTIHGSEWKISGIFKGLMSMSTVNLVQIQVKNLDLWNFNVVSWYQKSFYDYVASIWSFEQLIEHIWSFRNTLSLHDTFTSISASEQRRNDNKGNSSATLL